MPQYFSILISFGVSSPQFTAKFFLCAWYFYTPLLGGGNPFWICFFALFAVKSIILASGSGKSPPFSLKRNCVASFRCAELVAAIAATRLLVSPSPFPERGAEEMCFFKI
jgi:hypothetical protein